VPPSQGYGAQGYGGAPLGQQPYSQQGYGGQPYAAAPPNNQKALWALILGIVGLVCCGFLAGIPAIILGKQAQNEIDASGGAQGGRGMATAGFVMGIIACALGVLFVILYAAGVATMNFNINN